jgi:hypothetical protein
VSILFRASFKIDEAGDTTKQIVEALRGLCDGIEQYKVTPDATTEFWGIYNDAGAHIGWARTNTQETKP